MTSSKHTKRALLASVLSVALCCAMLVGSTFAWFTDSVTSTGNIIKSGTLDVTMKWAKGTEDPASATWKDASEGAIFDYDLWEPGYTEVRHVRISNVGSLALKYEVRIAATGEVSELADVIDVYYIEGGVQITDRTQLNDSNKIGTLTEVLAKPYAAKGNLLGKKGETVDADIATIALKMQESAGNEYQDLSIGSEFAIQLVATQDTVEEDSFGKDYDVNAVYPEVPNQINTEIMGTVNGESATVLEDKESGVTATIPAGATTETTVKLSVTTTATTADSVTYDISLTNGEGGNVTLTHPVKIKLNIGKNLKNVAVKHNGEPMEASEFQYDASSGVLTIETSSFSPFEVTFEQDVVASVGSIGYSSINAAITAAKDGDTILVTENVTANSTMLNLVQDKAVTVNLNGNVLTYTGPDRSVQLAYGAEMTILDGTINMLSLNPEDCAGIFVFGDANPGNACKLTMRNVTVNSNNLGVFSQGANNEITLDGCEINSAYFGVYQNGSNSPSVFNITSSTIKDTAGAGIYISNSSADGREKQTLNITNSTVIGPTAVEIKHTNATITGSTLIGTATPTGSGTNNNGSCTAGYALAVTTNGTEDYVTGTVTVSDCKFYNGETSEGVPNGYCFVYTVADGSSVTIDGEAVSDYNTYGGETGSAG